MSILVDPNIVYLALVGGLWLAVTAMYMPGTGILEVLAGAMVIGAVVLLAGMPTNWIAVVLILLGTSAFLILPFVSARYRHAGLVGLAIQTLGSLFLFQGTSVFVPLIAVIAVISYLYHHYVLLSVRPAALSGGTAMLDDHPMEGEHGVVTTELKPIGTVRARGETWTARIRDGFAALPSGTSIIVVKQEGLTLIVEPEKAKQDG
jgi:membrane-bound ClpP family serine protease